MYSYLWFDCNIKLTMPGAAVNLSIAVYVLIATKKSTMAGGAVVNLYISVV